VQKEFEDRLRQLLEELVRSRVGSLEQEISRLQRELNASFTSLLESTDAATAIPESDLSLSRISAEVEAQVGQASAESAKLGSDLALLRDSVDEIGQQQTQAEVLNSLVERIANFAPRVVLFVVKGSNALGWAARGFDDTLGNATIRGLSVSLQSDTILQAAINSLETCSSAPEQHTENNLILSRLGGGRPERLLAAPLKVRGKSAAVLYADSSDRAEDSVNIEAIELLVSTTGLVVELTSLRARAGEAPAKAPVQQTPSGSLQPQPAAQAPAAAPAAFSGATGGLGERRSQPSSPMIGGSGPLTPAQGRKTSGDLAAPAASDAAWKAPKGNEDERQHTDARRFARLLVSEIKLYNEQKVIEGRRNGDLYERLKEDIDRSRQMYDKRITAGVTGRFDYFYEELVNTLAEGDPAKLGASFPAQQRP